MSLNAVSPNSGAKKDRSKCDQLASRKGVRLFRIVATIRQDSGKKTLSIVGASDIDQEDQTVVKKNAGRNERLVN